MKTLSSVGLSTKDETVLKALVDLLGARTRDTWVYSAESRADAVILDTDNVQVVTRWLSEPGAKASTSIAYSGGTTQVPAQHYLAKPLRAADLIAVLNTIEDQPETALPSDQATPSHAALSAAHQGQPRDSSLAQSVSDRHRGYLRISGGGEEVILDRSQRRCQSTLAPERVGDWLRDKPADLDVGMSDSPFDGAFDSSTGDSAWAADRDLLWALGLYGSAGRLLRQLDPASRFKLQRWPDPSLLKHSEHCVSLCALLSRKSGVTLDEITAASTIPREDAIGFVNAASLTGILTVRTVKIDVEAPRSVAETASKGLFAKIRSRLKV